LDDGIRGCFKKVMGTLKNTFHSFEGRDPDFSDARDCFWTLRCVNYLASHRTRYEKHRNILSKNIIANIEAGEKMSLSAVSEAETQWRKIYRDFEVFFENEFAVATNNSITNFLERKYEDFENNFIELSKKTFDNFQEMIPSNFKKLWTDGIENEDYYLKLCGSGGGGFLIGFTRDIDTIDQYFPKKNFEVLLRF